MKKLSFLVVFGFLLLVSFYSPNTQSSIVHVDTDYILNKIPAYKDAMNELDALAQQYKEDIDSRIKEVDSLFQVYQKNEVLMTPEMKSRLKQQIAEKDQEVKTLQKKYFGPKGLLAQKREELLKPIMDNVYQAVEEMAKEAHYDYVFDKATGEILYANENNDQSDVILKKLGY